MVVLADKNVECTRPAQQLVFIFYYRVNRLTKPKYSKPAHLVLKKSPTFFDVRIEILIAQNQQQTFVLFVLSVDHCMAIKPRSHRWYSGYYFC